MIRLASILILLLAASTPLAAQRARRKQPGPPKGPSPAEKKVDLAEAAAQSRANLIGATKDYRTSLEKLLALQSEDEMRAAAVIKRQRALLDQGVISKRELEASETAAAEARGKAEETRKRIGEANEMLVEVMAADQLAKMPAQPPGAFRSTVTLIRYTGTGRWALPEIGKVDAFFRLKFGRPLPVSAFGQSATHNRLGFDHRESVDVAVHPDTPEGRLLIQFLQTQGIPFTAFRAAVPGSATGAHFHIGRPSQRIAPSL